MKNIFNQMTVILVLLVVKGSVVYAAGEDTVMSGGQNSGPIPITKDLVLDLDANKGVEVEDGNRVKSWQNQVIGNEADVFVKRDKGRKKPGSGRQRI